MYSIYRLNVSSWLISKYFAHLHIIAISVDDSYNTATLLKYLSQLRKGGGLVFVC